MCGSLGYNFWEVRLNISVLLDQYLLYLKLSTLFMSATCFGSGPMVECLVCVQKRSKFRKGRGKSLLLGILLKETVLWLDIRELLCSFMLLTTYAIGGVSVTPLLKCWELYCKPHQRCWWGVRALVCNWNEKMMWKKNLLGPEVALF